MSFVIDLLPVELLSAGNWHRLFSSHEQPPNSFTMNSHQDIYGHGIPRQEKNQQSRASHGVNAAAGTASPTLRRPRSHTPPARDGVNTRESLHASGCSSRYASGPPTQHASSRESSPRPAPSPLRSATPGHALSRRGSAILGHHDYNYGIDGPAHAAPPGPTFSLNAVNQRLAAVAKRRRRTSSMGNVTISSDEDPDMDQNTQPQLPPGSMRAADQHGQQQQQQIELRAQPTAHDDTRLRSFAMGVFKVLQYILGVLSAWSTAFITRHPGLVGITLLALLIWFILLPDWVRGLVKSMFGLVLVSLGLLPSSYMTNLAGSRFFGAAGAAHTPFINATATVTTTATSWALHSPVAPYTATVTVTTASVCGEEICSPIWLGPLPGLACKVPAAPPPALKDSQGRDDKNGKGSRSKTQGVCSPALFAGDEPVGLELVRLDAMFNEQIASPLNNLLRGLRALLSAPAAATAAVDNNNRPERAGPDPVQADGEDAAERRRNHLKAKLDPKMLVDLLTEAEQVLGKALNDANNPSHVLRRLKRRMASLVTGPEQEDRHLSQIARQLDASLNERVGLLSKTVEELRALKESPGLGGVRPWRDAVAKRNEVLALMARSSPCSTNTNSSAGGRTMAQRGVTWLWRPWWCFLPVNGGRRAREEEQHKAKWRNELEQAQEHVEKARRGIVEAGFEALYILQQLDEAW